MNKNTFYSILFYSILFIFNLWRMLSILHRLMFTCWKFSEIRNKWKKKGLGRNFFYLKLADTIARYKNRNLKPRKDRTIKESELKTNRHNRPIQKSELETKKQDRTIKESELKANRHNRPIQKSELDINRLYRPIQSEDRIGIGKSINRTFRPPLPAGL